MKDMITEEAIRYIEELFQENSDYFQTETNYLKRHTG